MMPIDYLITLGIGFLILAASTWPMLFSIVIAWLPGSNVRNRMKFVFVCFILACGISGLLELAVLPFTLADTYLFSQLEVDGYDRLASALRKSARVLAWLPVAGLVISSVAIPLVLRAGLWERLLAALSRNAQLQ